MVGSCRNIGVIGRTPVAYFIPFGVEPFQFVGIFILIVEDIIQCGIFNHYIGLVVFQDNLLLGGDIFFQDAVFVVRLYQIVVDIELVEDDRRHVRVGDNIVRVKESKPVVAGKEYPVVGQADACTGRKLLYLYAAFLSVIDNIACAKVEI